MDSNTPLNTPITNKILNESPNEPPNKKQKLKKKSKVNRCEMCNKKIGLCGIKCRCEKIFCGSCITSSVHNCTFNYKEEHQNELKKNLGFGNFSKINSI